MKLPTLEKFDSAFSFAGNKDKIEETKDKEENKLHP